MSDSNPDFVLRLKSMLPRGWLADVSPTTDALVSGFAAAWTFVFGLIGTIDGLTRIATATGVFLDLISSDYFGDALLRKLGETDAAFQTRIKQELLRPRCTRGALENALEELTGRKPHIVEPVRPADTGAYTVGGVAYGLQGAWGSLLLSHSVFVTAYRPEGGGISQVAGYGTAGPLIYGSIAMVTTALTDLNIYAAAADVMPVDTVAWVRIES